MFTPQLNLISATMLLGIIQALFLAIVFLGYGRKGNHVFIGIAMLILALIEFESFLNYTGYVIYAPWIINTTTPMIFALGPLSYFYIRRTSGYRSFKKRDLLHFAPALSYFFYSFFFFFQNNGFKINSALKANHPEAIIPGYFADFPTDPLRIQGFVVIEGLAIHLLIYSIVSFVFLRKQSAQVTQKRSRYPVHVRWAYIWMLSLLIGSMLLLSTGGVINGIRIYKSWLPAFTIDIYCVLIIYINMAYWLGDALIPFISQNKYSKSPLDQKDQQSLLAGLQLIMLRQKPYKNADFSLNQLARLAQLSPHVTSQVINAGSGMSFNEFVNWYRIDEARKLLTDPAGDQIKVEGLAYELGYKSKSAFFTSFRRFTDTTPGRFRDLHKKT